MRVALLALLIQCLLVNAGIVAAAAPLEDAQTMYRTGSYFKAARYAFDAAQENPELKAEAYSWITLSLLRAGLPDTASYFFIRTLQMGNKNAIRRVLGDTESLLIRVGPDILRKYLIRHTKYEDYDARNRSAYLYALAKEAILSGSVSQAIGYLNGIQSESPLWPVALQLRGTSNAILGNNEQAIRDFRACQSRASVLRSRAEQLDLRSRCLAGEARTLYQMERLDEADQTYDRIPKTSFVWPDILFEQAWNAFGRKEFNRSLGRLVSYKSPALSFVWNSEADVLRAQSYLALCLYSDANEAVNEFNSKYTRVGEQVKQFVENRSKDLGAFHNLGKEALQSSLYTRNEFHRIMNRFIRGPYFQNLIAAERHLNSEAAAVRHFASQSGLSMEDGKGFPGFLNLVLKWRARSIQLLGGTFVKNSLIDYHSALIGDFEKMAFIKLEMLKQAKEQLLSKPETAGSSKARGRGNVEPKRRDYQYRWSFNGEFWNDELGDYVFGLESECKNGG
ncbi:MAG TPA: hypothetical protein DCS07_03955 [Bdellovibrionales bacterium]|nr:MAG: hypothetical protein A2X97_15260 [Bdellovibrionales bacterium GWA1_52_35]OFZ33291.1 MAG: hypothetical protein A2070_14670 [Bdellovibrionales bacterium GWC1_52_8]HAR41772.1 hypothetical protein [Bdellovibrionales bacterium]HCM40496.1 hypothetical protein [Bdellovibrionales bacterium]